MSERPRKKHGEGSYDKIITNVNEIEIADFINPWTFSTLFMSSDEVLFSWMREKGLLASRVPSPECGKNCKLNKRGRTVDKFSFRCSKHSGVEITMRKFSFFEGSPYNIRDLCVFVKEYLEGHSLLQCALATGMDYKHTAVDWASYIREMFCQYTFDMYNMTQFEGEVELDESLFGRKIKYNKGEPKGHRIWIFGIIHRESNKLILYPVNQRNADTLIPIIQRHVAPGSRIYSDSWAAYLQLNEVGYEHYTVCHKTTFKQSYQCVDTGDIIHCHTNRIEGAWKHCKDHFRKMNGTNLKLFEQHLAEIVWRNHHQNQNRYVAFFDLVKGVYTLDMPRQYTYPKPLFDTWTPPSEQSEREHNITIVRCSSESEEEPESQAPQTEAADATAVSPPATVNEEEPGPSNVIETRTERSTTQPQPNSSSDTTQTITRTVEDTEPTRKINDRNVTTRKKRQLKPQTSQSKDAKSEESDWEEVTSQRLFHPKNVKPVRKGKKEQTKSSKQKKLTNPYSKQAFVFDSDTDSDFV